MATRKTTARRRAHVDRHGGQAPEVLYSFACESFKHARCSGIILSLLADPGAKCACPCHREGRAA